MQVRQAPVDQVLLVLQVILVLLDQLVLAVLAQRDQLARLVQMGCPALQAQPVQRVLVLPVQLELKALQVQLVPLERDQQDLQAQHPLPLVLQAQQALD